MFSTHRERKGALQKRFMEQIETNVNILEDEIKEVTSTHTI